MLKLITLTAILAFAQSAAAYIYCAGETYTGNIVEVTIVTDDRGAAQEGQVKFTIKDGSVQQNYSFKANEIVQYFESEDNGRAIVGVAAFQGGNNPIWIKYVGTNHQNNLIEALRDSSRKKQNHNEMRVWKGPGFGPEQQNQFTDVVCNVGY